MVSCPRLSSDPLIATVDAAGPTHLGFTKWLKDLGFLAGQSHIKHEYNANKQLVAGIFTIPPHLQELVPIPWGFKPGQVAVHAPNPALKEDRILLFSVVDRNRRELNYWKPVLR